MNFSFSVEDVEASGVSDILAQAAALMPYHRSAIGASARRFIDKLDECVTPQDFGACSPNVLNDSPAIQAAVSYVALGAVGRRKGGRLFMPASDYKIFETVIFPAVEPISFIGEGNGTCLIKHGEPGAMIELRSGSLISGIFFRGHITITGGSNAIYCNGANTARIADCYFENQTTPIELHLSYAVEIVSCSFDVCYSYGIVATTSAHNTVIERCHFFTCGMGGNGQAINFLIPSDNLVIKSNDFEYCNVNIALNACNSVQIVGNYFEYHKTACFDFKPGCTGVVIEANWIALGDVAGGGFDSVIRNITGGRFAHNTLYNQKLSFDANALIGFDVGISRHTGTGSVGGAPWVSPVLLNGWVQQANHTAVGYLKDSLGRVYLRGAMVNGASPTTLFVLPPAYRPTDTAFFPTASANGWGRVSVRSDGAVVAESSAANNACLDGISFYVG